MTRQPKPEPVTLNPVTGPLIESEIESLVEQGEFLKANRLWLIASAAPKSLREASEEAIRQWSSREVSTLDEVLVPERPRASALARELNQLGYMVESEENGGRWSFQAEPLPDSPRIPARPLWELGFEYIGRRMAGELVFGDENAAVLGVNLEDACDEARRFADTDWVRRWNLGGPGAIPKGRVWFANRGRASGLTTKLAELRNSRRGKKNSR